MPVTVLTKPPGSRRDTIRYCCDRVTGGNRRPRDSRESRCDRTGAPRVIRNEMCKRKTYTKVFDSAVASCIRYLHVARTALKIKRFFFVVTLRNFQTRFILKTFHQRFVLGDLLRCCGLFQFVRWNDDEKLLGIPLC